ncbi:rho guanine nucleotide exchange factor 5 isoform X1 [Mustela erminea]|uniref:rho guanine nucleotide exchange factor 5 isoform X1 n=1 Tax=Mustela erminea TaxID=36723 RepID=UPI0013875325|nr:rho guanine nucleotide exchange factor 5 isoform X1 [Mustela erminea]XP_032160676.1 rho guanine nucleotide exchange factor 5 isoform X1 [Mustela erminea]
MEAEEPQHGVSTPIPALAELSVTPEALRRSRQTAALGPEAQEGGEPSSAWAEGRGLSETPRGASWDVKSCATKSVMSFPKEAPAGAETTQEDSMGEMGDTPECPELVPPSPTDGGVRTPAPSELGACLVQGEHLDMAPGSGELGGGVEMEFRPEPTSSTGETGHAEEEEAFPDASAQPRFGPSCEQCPEETHQPGDSVRHGEEPQLTAAREGPGSGGPECLLGAEGLGGQGPADAGFQEEAAVGEGGRSGEQEQKGEQGDRTEGEQRPKREQRQGDPMPARQGERMGLCGDSEGLHCREQEMKTQGRGDPPQGEEGKRELGGPQESSVDAQNEERQSLVGRSGKGTGRQEGQGLQRKVMFAQRQEEEPGNWDGAPLWREAGERSTEEGEARDGPSTQAPVASPCDLFLDTCHPKTSVPGTQREPQAEEPLPVAPAPALESGQWSSQPVSLPGSFPAGESPDQEIALDSQQEGSELGKGAVFTQGTELVSAGTSAAPPRTPGSAPCSPADVSPSTATPSSASAPVASSRRESSLAAHSSETSRASLWTNNTSHAGASETPSAALRGFLTTEATVEISTSSSQANPPSPLGHSTGAFQHLRSNSFPGSHRTEPTPDLLGLSLSFSHSELPQEAPKPAIYGSVIPRRDRKSGRDGRIIPESPSSLSALGKDSQEFTSDPERSGSPYSTQPCGSRHTSASAPESIACGSSPPLVSVDARVHEPLPPPPPEKRRVHPSMVERDSHLHAGVPMLKRCGQPLPLAPGSGLHGPPKGPLPPVPDSLVARQHRPLPSTPDTPHPTQTSPSHRLRYNKPLPPTPDLSQTHHSVPSSSSPRTYRPLPPVPIVDPPTEPPPLPPKSRGRSRSTQGELMNAGGQGKPRPICPERTATTPHSVGRTSWPPAMGRSTDSSAPTSRSKSEGAPGMAFSNVATLLSPSSPTTPWSLELPGPTSEPGPSEESGAPGRGSLRRTAPQEGANGLRRLDVGQARQPAKLSHPHLEKASSWPHRRDPGRPPASSSGQVVDPGEGSSRHKGWNRQGLRRPSILPEGCSDTRGPAVEKVLGPSDTIVFREKKPKEVMGGFSRRRSKLINSSQLLYQEYSDVVLNKEIQSQQRLDSLGEATGPASPRQPRRTLVSSESYLQRLSMASSGSLWQEIPVVRNSTVLLSMTHEDQKLQEAKFELIVSEASYLRSLHVAVDHFQLSAPLRATLSNQEYQWLFSRLQDVRDVSTTFLSDLEENFERNIFTFQVCDVVLNHAPGFRRVYLPYVTNQTYQERTFQGLLTSNSSFREVLEKLESDPVCQRLSLKSFLILPFQRITRLKLLLQNILKRTQPGSSEEAEATKAHHALEELIRDCNNNVQRMRRTEELIYLSQKIEFECKIFPLISQSRWLVKSGELTALEFSLSPGLRRKLNTRPVHLHLFNDCLLLSRPREGSRFLVFDHAPFSSIRGEKCEMKLHGPHKNLFRLFLLHNAQGTQAEFLFSTETQSEKLRWISALAMPREELDLLECYDSPQVQCLRAYKPRENDELALEKADVVMVTQQSSDGWLEGMRLSDGERGWFPVQQVEFISNPDVRARNLKEAHRVKTAKLQLVEQRT